MWEKRRIKKAIIKTGKHLDVLWQYYSKLTDNDELVYCLDLDLDLDWRFVREEIYSGTTELDDQSIVAIIHWFLGV